MTQEQEPINNQEAKVWMLRNEIIGKLTNRGGDPTLRIQAMGYEIVQVANDEDRGGSSALILDINGGWSMKFGMGGYSINNPTIFDLLKQYAYVKDDAFKALRIERLRNLSDNELREYREKQDEKERSYIHQNKPQLLQGLIRNLEETLQKL